MRVSVSRKPVCNHLENIFCITHSGRSFVRPLFSFQTYHNCLFYIIKARGCNEYGKNVAGACGFLARYAGE